MARRHCADRRGESSERLQEIVLRNARARTKARIVQKVGTEHLVIRIDLDDAPGVAK